MEKKKFKIGKIILFVLIIIILGIFAHTTRNFIIISKLQNIFQKYETIENYHLYSVTYDDTGRLESNYYNKNDKKAWFIEKMDFSGNASKVSIYYNEGRSSCFIENDEEKSVNLEYRHVPNLEITNGIETSNFHEKIMLCFHAKIKNVIFNGRECYEITKSIAFDFSDAETIVSIIDKETALVLCSKDSYSETNRITEINNVDDSVFIEPNISEYDIKKNNF